MKQKFIYYFLILVFILFGTVCNEQGPLSSEVEIIKSNDIPRPFSNSTYFIYGEKLEVGELSILENLERQGFALQDAWVPTNNYMCMSMYPPLKQMIVRLNYPDSKIYSLNFTSDSTLIDFCFTTWEHYRYYR